MSGHVWRAWSGRLPSSLAGEVLPAVCYFMRGVAAAQQLRFGSQLCAWPASRLHYWEMPSHFYGGVNCCCLSLAMCWLMRSRAWLLPGRERLLYGLPHARNQFSPQQGTGAVVLLYAGWLLPASVDAAATGRHSWCTWRAGGIRSTRPSELGAQQAPLSRSHGMTTAGHEQHCPCFAGPW